jgi:hypothetical protein
VKVRVIANFSLSQAAWFACVLGAAGGLPWLGPACVAAFLALSLKLSDKPRAELKLYAAAVLTGFTFDTSLTAAGLFLPLPHLLPAPLSPPWLIALWPNLAAMLNVSLAWLKGRYLLAAAFGALGGPLAYYGGAKMGAVLALPGPEGLLALAAGWAAATPLLLWLAAHFRGEKPGAPAPLSQAQTT